MTTITTTPCPTCQAPVFAALDNAGKAIVLQPSGVIYGHLAEHPDGRMICRVIRGTYPLHVCDEVAMARRRKEQAA